MDAHEDLDCIHLADFQGSKWALYKINNTLVENENVPKFEYNVEEKLCYLFDSGQ